MHTVQAASLLLISSTSMATKKLIVQAGLVFQGGDPGVDPKN